MRAPFQRVDRPTSWRRLAIAGWRRPNDPTVYGSMEIDMTNALALIERLREQAGARITVTHLVVKALARALAAYPDANGLIIGRKVYRRNTVDIFCQVASDDERDLSGVKIARADQTPLLEIARSLDERAARVRSGEDRVVERTKSTLGRLPDWVLSWVLEAVRYLTYNLRLDLTAAGVPFDQFGSAMVSNIGSVDAGLGIVFAPLVPVSHVPIVVLVNALVDRPAVVEGRIVARPTLALGCTFDHRFFDGMIGARVARTLRDGLLHPDQLVP